MSDKIKHIKITKPTGQVSFTVFNQDTYNRLNDQNKNLSPERKNKVETVDISEEDVQKHSGFDENAVMEMNPAAANLLAIKESQDKRIQELEAALEASYEDQKNKGKEKSKKTGDGEN